MMVSRRFRRSKLRKKHGSYMKHMDTAIPFLNQLPCEYPGKDVANFLGGEREKLRSMVQALGERVTRCKAQLEELWAKESKMVYELSSVFFHRGSSPSWGHYFFYTRHLPDKPDSWFKMNDSQVTAVSKEEVLADTTDSTANAYLVSCSIFSNLRPMLKPI
jgi:ubiquitin carboxyl-terminal hydrolase 25